jgi:hypothetical protein
MMPKAILAAFGVTFAIQVAQPVLSSIPTIDYVLRGVLGITFLLACIKAVAFFGAMIKGQQILTEQVGKAGDEARRFGDKFEAFAGRIEALLMEHDGDIKVLQSAKIEIERRVGDVERRHGPGQRVANHHDLDPG